MTTQSWFSCSWRDPWVEGVWVGRMLDCWCAFTCVSDVMCARFWGQGGIEALPSLLPLEGRWRVFVFVLKSRNIQETAVLVQLRTSLDYSNASCYKPYCIYIVVFHYKLSRSIRPSKSNPGSRMDKTLWLEPSSLSQCTDGLGLK